MIYDGYLYLYVDFEFWINVIALIVMFLNEKLCIYQKIICNVLIKKLKINNA